MFKWDNEDDKKSYNDEISSQIANWSIDDKYMGNTIFEPDFRFDPDQQSKIKIDEQMLLDYQNFSKYSKYDKLVSITELNLQKLNDTIEKFISTQNGISKLVNLSDFKRPIELEFSSRPHPFKIFEMSELPNLESDQRTIYNNCLVESKNDSALAYYLFKNKDLSRSSKAAIKSWYLKLI